MAYREVGVMDTDQVIRRWLAGEKIRAIAAIDPFGPEHDTADLAFSGRGGSPARDAVAQ